MSSSVARKFTLASMVFVSALVFVTGGAWFVSERLGEIQDEGATEVRMAMEMQRLSARGAAMYQVIADGEINHDLGVTRADWQTVKGETEKLFADTKTRLKSDEERAGFAEAETYFKTLTGLFEQQMLTALDASLEMTPDIRRLDGEIDEARTRMTAPLNRLSEAYDKRA